MYYTRNCERCQTEFTRKVSGVSQHKARYCSRACQGAARREATAMITFTCEHCSKSVTMTACMFRNCPRRFCGRACSIAHRVENPVDDVAERFWKRVNKTDSCWLWTGAKGQAGYGQLSIKNKQVKAHRISYELHHGSIPDGYFVCHRCDNPNCVNPDHLFAGTGQDNMTDMANKGRSLSGDRNPGRLRPETRARGTQNGNAKLNESAVREIRSLYHQGHSQEKLSKQFGVAQKTISWVLLGRTWKHVT